MTEQNTNVVSMDATALPADPITAMLQAIVANPNIPVDTISALMDVQERQMNKAAEQAYNKAFSMAISEMGSVGKSGKNTYRGQTYSTLDDLVRAARRPLSKYGLALNWNSDVTDTTITVKAIVRHADGWKETTAISAPINAGKVEGKRGDAMNAIQAYGSTETYLKRYTGFAILGLSSGDFDDDGNGASKAVKTITEDQCLELTELLAKAGVAASKLMLACGLSAELNLAQLPCDNFSFAKTRLEQKISKNAENVEVEGDRQ